MSQDVKSPSNVSSNNVNSQMIPPNPNHDEYWSYRIYIEAKKKVISYFALLGVLVSIIVTLFGMDRIRSLIDEQYERRVKEREEEASARLQALTKAFEAQLSALQVRVETRSAEFHHQVGVSLEQIQTVSYQQSTLHVDISDAIGPIRDQKSEGPSVGFALAYALNGEVVRAQSESPIYSARSIFVEARRWDEWPGEDYLGTSLTGGAKALENKGAYLESDWPNNQIDLPRPDTTPNRLITRYQVVSKDRIDLIISALGDQRPVAASINVPEEFGEIEANGKLQLSEDLKIVGGHAICLVGYNATDDEFKFANSWGNSWGASGFGFIERGDLERILMEAVIITL